MWDEGMRGCGGVGLRGRGSERKMRRGDLGAC